MKKNKTLLFFLLALLGLLLVPGCKKKPGAGKEAVAQATAEYSCDAVELLSSEGKYHKLDVCGTVRHYRCTVESCGSNSTCKEVKQKK